MTLAQQRAGVAMAKVAAAMSMVRTLGRIHRLGKGMFPDFTWEHIRNRFLMLVRTRKHLPAIRAWYETTDNPWLAVAQSRHPLLGGAMYLPYIHHDWTPSQRLEAIGRHYRLIDWQTAILAHAIAESIEVAHFEAEYSGLKLVLDRAPWFNREGEVALNLFVDNHRCYSVVFTLAEDAGERILIIGALQGSSQPPARDLYRDLTHALHGMRPRDLLLASLKLLAKQFGIRRLWAISSGKRWQVPADYDAIWSEHRGELQRSGFFVLPAEVQRRQPAELPVKKRKAYRLRYEMLDRLSADITAACTLAAARLAASFPRQPEPLAQDESLSSGTLADASPAGLAESP